MKATHVAWYSGGFRIVWRALLISLVLILVALANASCIGRGQTGAQKDTTKGSQLYTANCQSCHGGASGGQVMDIPPPHNANGHTWHHSDCQIKEIVVNGSGEMEEMMRRVMGSSESTPQMPAFKETLSDEEIDTILDYIKSWWKPEQREFQAEVTRAQC